MSGRGRGGGGGGRGAGQTQNLPFHPAGRGGAGGGGGFRGGRGGGRGRGGPVSVEIYRPSDGSRATPNEQVTKVENQINNQVLLAKTAKSKQTKSLANPPTRPGFGTKGKPVTLWANYFQLSIKPETVLFRYDLEMKDEKGKEPSKTRARVITQLLLEQGLNQYKSNIATDFRSTIISNKKFEVDDATHNASEHTDSPDGPKPAVYTCRVLYTNTLTLGELIKYLASADAGAVMTSKDDLIQALNIIVGFNPKASDNVAQVAGNNYFHQNPDISQRRTLSAGVMAVRGFFCSVRAATARLLVNVQVKNVAFYEPGRLDTLMQTYLSVNPDHIHRLSAFLKGLQIDATHLVRRDQSGRRIPRMKRITGLARRADGKEEENPPEIPKDGASAREVKFWLQEEGSSAGRRISVQEFFKKKYGITLKRPDLPVVNVGKQRHPVYLPAEVCNVPFGSPFNRKLDSSQTTAMIGVAVQTPANNANYLTTSATRVLGFDQNNPTLKAFDTSVDPRLLAVAGRILSIPQVQYAKNQTITPRFGTWNLTDTKVFRGATLTNWTWLKITEENSPSPAGLRTSEEIREQMARFEAALSKSGLTVSQCLSGLNVDGVRENNIEEKLMEKLGKFAKPQGGRQPPTTILVILPSERAYIYNCVKSLCDVTYGFVNVCVQARRFVDARPDYYANVALKFNLKLGGRNHAVEPSKLNIISQGKTMLVGLDVTHPSPGSADNAPSIASIVASVNKELAQWPADIRVQERRKEMVTALEELVKSRLALWHGKNNQYPDNILVYRDGVSEGQYQQVLEQELPGIRKACTDTYSATSTKQGLPKITIVIVGKRHNTRFYASSAEEASRSSNPLNGTVVDRGITEARNWDFFLQAHHAIKGTARSAHYYVLHDEIFRALTPTPGSNVADMVEELTHSLCYLFGRATKAVSLCPPAYYADLVCDRARRYLSKVMEGNTTQSVSSGSTNTTVTQDQVQIHARVKNTMFYL